MYNYPISLTSGLIAMLFVFASYMVSKKTSFLITQTIAIIFLSLSYLFVEQYFAMLGTAIAAIRMVIYFALEKKNKAPSFYLKSLFALLSVVSYLVVNIIILQSARFIDLLLLVANIMYSYLSGVRDLKLLRYLFLMPTAMVSVYNLIAPATLFVIISYIFEFIVNIIGIIKANVKEKREKVIPFSKNKKEVKV